MDEDSVVALPRPGASVTDDPLLAVLRDGARRMLMQAIEAEVEAFLAVHAELAHNRPLAPGDRSVDIRITRLRQKLEPDAANPTVLRTVRGEGYAYEPEG